jgi:uncharacterized protein with HEPN domain
MRDEELYLRDIVEAAGAIDRFLAGMSEDEWIDDEVRQSAAMHQLIIIGEAASRLSLEFREAHPQVAWADIVGFRNLAVHAYFSVSWPIVWVTATEDVPVLHAQIAEILTNEYSPE